MIVTAPARVPRPTPFANRFPGGVLRFTMTLDDQRLWTIGRHLFPCETWSCSTTMKLSVADVTQFLNAFAPPALAESWDNVGLLVGRAEQPVERVMTCL